MVLRIENDGMVRGLWTDQIDWPALGRVSVRRASHVEFDATSQLWIVRAAQHRTGLRTLLAWLIARTGGEILFRAHRREEALAWERAYFGPGGAGWSRAAAPRKEGIGIMSILDTLWGFLAGWLRRSQNVRDHERRQAFGPRWKEHRPKRIQRYIRRRPRRSGSWL